jgi:hypothetical protein
LRKFVVLVAVVAALGVGAFVLRQRKEAESRRERQEARLLEFDERDVRAVVLTTAGGTWRFERREDGWRMTAPFGDAASEEAISDLMSATERVVVVQTVDDPEQLSAYGLEPPVVAVRFEGVDATLDLGNAVPTGGGMFARVPGRAGVLVLQDTVVSESIFNGLDPMRYRDPSFLGLAATSVDAIEARTPAGKVHLERADGAWWIVEPRRLPASAESVESILQLLERAQIKSFHDDVDPADAAFGLTPAAVEIDLSSGGTRRGFRLSAESPEGLRFATRDDRECVMEIAIADLDEQRLTAPALVTRRLSSVNRYRIEHFVYRRGDRSLTAERHGETWSAPDGADLPSAEVYSFLTGLLETPVTGFRESSTSSAGTVAEFRYRLEGGKEGSIEFLPGDLGRVSDVPGLVFALGGSAPAVP